MNILTLCRKDQLQGLRKSGLYENVFSVNNKKYKTGAFFRRVNWNKVPPLSEELIEAMKPCEAGALKMVERIRQIGPKRYEARRSYYLKQLRYWDYYLDKFEIAAFFRHAAPHLGFDYIIYSLCKHKGIPTILRYKFHPGMAYLLTDIKDPFPVDDRKSGALLSPLSSMLEDHWKKRNPRIPPTVRPTKKKGLPGMAFYEAKSVAPNYRTDYIYFPLHYQYEASTSPMAGVFTDQLLIAEILGRLGIPVYVKEHPHISRNRSNIYYKRLLAIPNMKLVPVSTDTYKLIDNAVAVAVATGTAGWEAVMRGKPVLIFGYNFYKNAPGVFKVGSVEECRAAMEKIKMFRADKEGVIDFVRMMQVRLFPDTTGYVVGNVNKKIQELLLR